jgi:uncharacterized protein
VIVAAARVQIRLPENQSLKGKRQVIKSVLARVRREFGVAAAEVDAQDRWQIAVLGFASVSSSEHHAREILDAVLDYVEESRLDVEVLEVEVELLGM